MVSSFVAQGISQPQKLLFSHRTKNSARDQGLDHTARGLIEDFVLSDSEISKCGPPIACARKVSRAKQDRVIAGLAFLVEPSIQVSAGLLKFE